MGMSAKPHLLPDNSVFSTNEDSRLPKVRLNLSIIIDITKKMDDEFSLT